MDIYGEGGGGGSAPKPPIEEDDTLQSKQQVKLLFVISEGEITSVEDILLNQVPIDQYKATWEYRPGTANQTLVKGFSDTEEPIASFAPINFFEGVEYFVSVPYDAAACRNTLTLNALKFITSSNDIIGYEVQFQVSVRPSTSALWTVVKTIVKKGKASSPYSWDVRIERPSGVTIASSWEIRIVRLTPDDTDSKHISPSAWSAATAIRETSLTYANSALVSIILTDADQFGGNIPEVAFKVKGVKVKIPTNYDPVSHTYTETPPWDGSLTETLFSYTANPAWHIYNIFNNSRYGLNITKADIDVISLYNLSKYCDELVSDGKGGTERRFEIHNQFYTRENVPTFLSFLLNICNANITSNEFGQISIMYDRPNQTVTKQVGNANVLEGEFLYSSSDLESRYNLANVTYNREEFNGRTDTATDTEESLITRYGLQTTDIVLPGCASEAQAIRKARWAIYTSSYLPNFVEFKHLFLGLTYHVGELVRVFDNENQLSTQTGIIKASSNDGLNTTLTLDRSITLSDDLYTVSFMGADGKTEETYPILETNQEVSEVSFVGVTTSAVNSLFILSGAVVPKLYKVIKVTKEEDTYTIMCLEHSEAKYSYIDQVATLPTPSGDFLNISSLTTSPVTNVTFVENFSSNGVTQNSTLEIYWDWDKNSSVYQAGFELTWKRDNQKGNYVDRVLGKSFNIENPIPGEYEVTVWAINPFSGIKSAGVTATYSFKTSSGTSSLQPPVNIFVTGTTGLSFALPDLNLDFQYNPLNASVSDELLDYIVEVYDTTGTTLKGTFSVKPNTTRGGTFTFPFSVNSDLFGSPTRTFNLKLYSRDTVGDFSLSATVQVTNPVPLAPSYTIISGSEASYIDITPPADLDLKGFVVYRSTTSGFTPQNSDIIYKGVNNYITLKGSSGITYYRVAAYDTFGETGLNLATEQSSTLLSTNLDTWTFDGLIFKPNDPGTNQVSWTAGTVSKNGGTPVSIASGNTTFTSGTRFVYYSGAGGTLSTTNDLGVAVGGVQILTAYKGGTTLQLDNSTAFVDGNLVLANTVGANQLVVDSAIITSTAQLAAAIIDTANVKNGAITNAKILDIIQSGNWSTVNKTGWKIDKNGNIVTYGALSILAEGSGDAILQTGAGAGVEWDKVLGLGKPADNADVTNYDDSRVSNVVEENNVLTVRRPVGGSYSNENPDVTGIIKIILPVLWTDTMLSFSVDVYNYLTDTSFTLLLGGYGNNSQSRWFNTSAILSGNIGANNHVRFGDDGTNSVIYIGDIGTVWQYPKVIIRDFQGGFNNFTRTNWESGWAIILEDNETNFTLSPGGNYSNALLDAKAISNQGALATKSSVDLNSSEVANKSLANLDPTQNSKLVNIQDNATAGADYATNVTNKPVSLNDINATEFDVIASQNSDAFISGNLIPNGNMTLAAADGRPLGVKASYGGAEKTNVSFGDSSKTFLKLHSATDDTTGCVLPAFRVAQGTSYTVFIRFKASGFSSDGVYFRIQELDSDLSLGNTHISDGASNSEIGVQQSTRQLTSFYENSGVTTSWQTLEFTYTPTPTAKWASVLILNWPGLGTAELHIDRVVVSSDATKGATWATDIAGQPSDTQLLNSNTTPADIGYTGDLDANKTTNTNQLTDGAGLGTTATWTSVASRPTNLSELNSSEGTKLTGIADGADVANVIEENNTLFINRPGGASFGANGDVTGIIKIKLPQSWSSTMIRFSIGVYNYLTGTSFTLEVGGYNHLASTKWINTSAVLLGATGSNNRVRFGHDGTKCVIYIGDITSSWKNPKIIVKDFQAGFNDYAKYLWESGWDITIENNETGFVVSAGADYADALLDAKSIKNQGTLATKNNVDLATTDVSNKSLANVDSAANSKLITIAPNADVTSQNTAQGIQNQGAFATLSQINATNITTFIANAAIKQAQIANLAVGSAQIQSLAVKNGNIENLAVDTLKIADGSVTLAYSTNGYSQNGTFYTSSITVNIASGVTSREVILMASAKFSGYDGDYSLAKFRRDGVKIQDFGEVFYTGAANYESEIATLNYKDTAPAAGTYTYSIEYEGGAPNFVNFTILTLYK